MLSRTLGSSRRFNDVATVAGELTEFSQLLFTLLIPHVDDFGRMAGDAFTVRLSVFPGSSRSIQEFQEALAALHAVKLITVYEVDDGIWLQVNKFEQHQAGLHKRTKSAIPEWSPGSSRKFPPFPSQENLREGNLREVEEGAPRARPSDARDRGTSDQRRRDAADAGPEGRASAPVDDRISPENLALLKKHGFA